ncbi:hypothetical protein J2T57_001140 [Natronocella acetinitrilica]|uniref:Uncharacterized protein n=1 Tax=Natronocella acetinitrilica TaxID=414046 RepID=A0AAE3G1N6_9GAMM|nr:hypothetical protein [Natronocella acetinitrilica]MCP1674041.1 hypothetical protein [Natronocella acetinitrilica]
MTEQTPADEQAAFDAVELGNRLAEDYPEEELARIAEGLLSGVVHYWLYARQPCDDPRCPDCAPYRSADWRLAELHRLVDDMARSSEYFHSPDDIASGSA